MTHVRVALQTLATSIALEAGISARVVQERLGYQKITATMDIYAHVLPAMEQEAADRGFGFER